MLRDKIIHPKAPIHNEAEYFFFLSNAWIYCLQRNQIWVNAIYEDLLREFSTLTCVLGFKDNLMQKYIVVTIHATYLKITGFSIILFDSNVNKG